MPTLQRQQGLCHTVRRSTINNGGRTGHTLLLLLLFQAIRGWVPAVDEATHAANAHTEEQCDGESQEHFPDEGDSFRPTDDGRDR